tara:strand:- start:1836 stop:1961 length:126 start_codon:yes stop_codon:yes gene_type:complete
MLVKRDETKYDLPVIGIKTYIWNNYFYSFGGGGGGGNYVGI